MQLLEELGRVADRSQAEPLSPSIERLLKDSDAYVRSLALRAVAWVGFDDALSRLTAALDDPERDVKKAAINGLMELGRLAKPAEPRLRQLAVSDRALAPLVLKALNRIR